MTASKRGRKPKYLHIITLDGINARQIYKKYKQGTTDTTNAIQFTPIIEYSSRSEPSQVTELSDKQSTSQVFYEKNSDHVTMIDFVNYGCLPERTDLYCWHCHHPFNTSPIGAPIKYIRKQADKNDRTAGTNEYFQTMGVYCSFPCCLAFINEHKHVPLYRNSKSLLYSLYFKLYGTKLKIKPAPSWECLKNYGGNLSIEEFRKKFCVCNYIITENIKRPFMVSVGKYIEEQRCGYI